MLNHAAVPWVARAVLAVFGIWTAMIVIEHGYTGFIDLALAGGWGAQVFVDLVIALTIVIGWMIVDANARGTSPWPYVVVTLFLGSIGPLVYLSLRTPPESDIAD